MATLRLFASAREAAGVSREEIAGATLASVLESADARYGETFAKVRSTCGIWVNGEPVEGDPAEVALDAADEVAVLPPVSGGCR